MMDDNVEIIRSNKGGMKLIHRGYMYTVHKKRQSGGIRWRCTQRSLHCKGSISTGNGPPKVNMPHNHIPDPHSVALARCRQFEEFADLTPFVETECDELEDSSLLKRVTESSTMKTQSPLNTSSPIPSTSSPKLKVVVKQPIVSAAPKVPAPTEPDIEEVCLRWNSHHNNMKSSFPSLLQREQYVDVTLASEGKTLKCHRLILSSCSSYFDEILSGISPSQHPVIFINGVEFWILKSLIDFMYVGEVHIEQNKLPQLLKVAEMLQIKGLTGKSMPGLNNDTIKNAQPAQTIVKVEEEIKKEVTPQKLPVKNFKLIPAAMIKAVDPLALLQPTFIEESPESMKTKEQPKKVIPKKMRKRRSSEHEVSPPPVLFRKGTKSRPNVKVPRYYHNDYEDVKVAKQEETSAGEETYDLNKVKSEPLDIEDTDVGFGQNQQDENTSKSAEKETTQSKVSEKNVTVVDSKENKPVKQDGDEGAMTNAK